MRIILFTHPTFLPSQSMPRFVKMLTTSMKERGFDVEEWTAQPFFYKISSKNTIKKWLGYLDQFLLFPLQVRVRIRKLPKDVLFVFADNALGPWVPLVAKRPHVIHCHDFLAQNSALGVIKENPTGFTGKIYQWYIRQGYRKGENFISVSKKTRDDLHRLLKKDPIISEVIYNGLNREFSSLNVYDARFNMSQLISEKLKYGYILHVGGNQWYKNRLGVVLSYVEWRKKSKNKIPLLLIGATPTKSLRQSIEACGYKSDIFIIDVASDITVDSAYAGAKCLLFPSLDEGFGWPVIEAMTLGCKVVTTDIAPLNEICKDAAFYIPRMPNKESEMENWFNYVSNTLEKVVYLDEQSEENDHFINQGYKNVKEFSSTDMLDSIEIIYKKILNKK